MRANDGYSVRTWCGLVLSVVTGYVVALKVHYAVTVHWSMPHQSDPFACIVWLVVTGFLAALVVSLDD
jgi:hypothetical protein